MSVTVTEPRFSRADVEALLSSRRIEREPRGSHGWPLAESTDPEKKWVVSKPKRDFITQMLNAEQERYRKLYPQQDHSALLWNVKPREE